MRRADDWQENYGERRRRVARPVGSAAAAAGGQARVGTATRAGGGDGGVGRPPFRGNRGATRAHLDA